MAESLIDHYLEHCGTKGRIFNDMKFWYILFRLSPIIVVVGTFISIYIGKFNLLVNMYIGIFAGMAIFSLIVFKFNSEAKKVAEKKLEIDRIKDRLWNNDRVIEKIYDKDKKEIYEYLENVGGTEKEKYTELKKELIEIRNNKTIKLKVVPTFFGALIVAEFINWSSKQYSLLTESIAINIMFVEHIVLILLIGLCAVIVSMSIKRMIADINDERNYAANNCIKIIEFFLSSASQEEIKHG